MWRNKIEAAHWARRTQPGSDSMARTGEAQFHFAGHVLVLPYQILHVAESGTLQGLALVCRKLAQHFSQIGGAHHRGRAVIGLCDPASEESRREVFLAMIELGIEVAQRGYVGRRDYQVGTYQDDERRGW